MKGGVMELAGLILVWIMIMAALVIDQRTTFRNFK